MTSAKVLLVTALAARKTAAALRTNIFALRAEAMMLTRSSRLGGLLAATMCGIDPVPVYNQHDTSVESLVIL